MVGFSDKMQERMNMLKDLKEQGLSKKEICNRLIKDKGWKKDKFYRTWASLEWGVVVNHSRPISPSPFKPIKKYIQDEKKCYFCNNSQVIEHHLSYNPERIIYLCESCHVKLHFIIETYHLNGIEKDERLNFYEALLRDINTKTNFAVLPKECETPCETAREIYKK